MHSHGLPSPACVFGSSARSVARGRGLPIRRVCLAFTVRDALESPWCGTWTSRASWSFIGSVGGVNRLGGCSTARSTTALADARAALADAAAASIDASVL